MCVGGAAVVPGANTAGDWWVCIGEWGLGLCGCVWQGAGSVYVPPKGEIPA